VTALFGHMLRLSIDIASPPLRIAIFQRVLRHVLH
jgi:hypothetical protein